MTLNWENKEWRNFQWDNEKMAKAERLFLEGAAVMIGATRYMIAADHELLLVELLTTEALDTSEIEGDYLDRGSVQSSIDRALGLVVDDVTARPAEQGIADMLVRSYKTLHKPLTKKMLCDWHSMIMLGRRDLTCVGDYRAHAEPILIVLGPDYARKIHFEAPPSQQVSLEMKRFLDRLQGQLNGRQEKAILRMLQAGPDGFEGGLSAANYRQITKATTATTTRDLNDLVQKGALKRVGEKKSTRYCLCIQLKKVKTVRLSDII